MTSGPITSWQIDWKQWKQSQTSFFWAPKSLWTVTAAMELKDAAPWKESYDKAVLCLVTQSCPTLCNLMDWSPSGSSVHGILQARMLEWVAMPSSRGFSHPRDWTQVSCVAGRFFTFWATREAHDKARQHVKKQRHHFTSKGLYSQSYGFSSSFAWMWKLGHKEGWAPKSWYFWAVDLEKTLESPLDS